MTDAPERPGRPTNHLAGQTSPYLIQHVHNPVDWHPWGEAALLAARRQDKPIFLSIGYAACHWCHVMERESFEDVKVAAFLRERFISIKVDREERPDVDEIYMTAVQLMTGQGGWPLTAFLTPEGEPFFGGTYFPPTDAYGRPGFLTLLRKIDEVWRERRADLTRSAAEMSARLRAIHVAPPAGATTLPGRAEMRAAAMELAGRFDSRWGGFGGAPKFPADGSLALLLREHARTKDPGALGMVRVTLDRMAQGGMYDHVGGGFARYSVDERWLVPHFEKMLYNQALLVPVYLDAWLVTRAPLYRRVVEETLDFVRRELTDPQGGFWSSLDADSEGHEGKFYVWTQDEIRAELGPADGDFFCELYDVSAGGNFEGRNIPNLTDATRVEGSFAPRAAQLRARLLAARAKRVRPATDDKVLTAWNGLAITAFARAAQAFGRPEDLHSARAAADFLLDALVRDGRLRASWRAGSAHLNAYLDDHAFFARGLIDLYETCFDRRYLDAAEEIGTTMVAHFADRSAGGFYFTSDDHEALLMRSRSTFDGALPAGSAVATEVLLRLGAQRDDDALRAPALATLRALHGVVAQAPGAFATLLAAADLAEGPIHQIAVVGELLDPTTVALLAAARGVYLPNRVIAAGSPNGAGAASALLAGKSLHDGRPAAYLCRDRACDAPTSDPGAVSRKLSE